MAKKSKAEKAQENKTAKKELTVEEVNASISAKQAEENDTKSLKEDTLEMGQIKSSEKFQDEAPQDESQGPGPDTELSNEEAQVPEFPETEEPNKIDLGFKLLELTAAVDYFFQDVVLKSDAKKCMTAFLHTNFEKPLEVKNEIETKMATQPSYSFMTAGFYNNMRLKTHKEMKEVLIRGLESIPVEDSTTIFANSILNLKLSLLA